MSDIYLLNEFFLHSYVPQSGDVNLFVRLHQSDKRSVLCAAISLENGLSLGVDGASMSEGSNSSDKRSLLRAVTSLAFDLCLKIGCAVGVVFACELDVLEVLELGAIGSNSGMPDIVDADDDLFVLMERRESGDLGEAAIVDSTGSLEANRNLSGLCDSSCTALVLGELGNVSCLNAAEDVSNVGRSTAALVLVRGLGMAGELGAAPGSGKSWSGKPSGGSGGSMPAFNCGVCILMSGKSRDILFDFKDCALSPELLLLLTSSQCWFVFSLSKIRENRLSCIFSRAATTRSTCLLI